MHAHRRSEYAIVDIDFENHAEREDAEELMMKKKWDDVSIIVIPFAEKNLIKTWS